MSQEIPAHLKVWQDRIAVMFLVREEMRRLDTLGLNEYFYPELAATEEQLVAVETHLGEPLNSGYRDFLLCANGWRGFFFSLQLFGTEDLMGSKLMNLALEALGYVDDAMPLFKDLGFAKEDLLPIAASFIERQMHVITRSTSHQPGKIIWFDCGEVESYLSFEDYFLAMTDYNREDLKDLPEQIESTLAAIELDKAQKGKWLGGLLGRGRSK